MDSRPEFKQNLTEANQRLIRTDPRTLKIRGVTSVVAKVALLVAFGACFFTRNLVNQAHQQVVQLEKITTVKEFNSLEKHSSPVYSKVTLTGHSDSVRSVAFSPDGQTVASASDDKTIKLWNLQRKKEIATLTGHSHSVRSVAFSPDGQTLASASADKTIKLWNLESKKEIATLTGHSKDVDNVVFSPNGQILASTSADKTIKLWNLPSQKESNNQPVPIVGHLFSRLWNLESQNPIATFTMEGYARNKPAFTPDGQTLASHDSRNIIMWNLRSKKTIATFKGGKHSPSTIAFSPDGKSFASARDKKLTLGDLQSKKAIAILADSGCLQSNHILAFSPDSKMFASASNNTNTIKMWDVQSQKESGILLIDSGLNVTSLAFSPDGKILASARYHNITLIPIDSSGY